jgi:hypothetical protein
MAEVDSLSEVSSLKSFRTDVYNSNPELGKKVFASSVERKEAESQVKALETRINQLRSEQQKSDTRNKAILEKIDKIKHVQ